MLLKLIILYIILFTKIWRTKLVEYKNKLPLISKWNFVFTEIYGFLRLLEKLKFVGSDQIYRKFDKIYSFIKILEIILLTLNYFFMYILKYSKKINVNFKKKITINIIFFENITTACSKCKMHVQMHVLVEKSKYFILFL